MSGAGKTFAKRFFASELIAFGFGFPVAAGYVLLLLNIPWDDVIKIVIFSSSVAVAVEIFVSQPMNFLVSRVIRRQVLEWDAGTLRDSHEVSDFFLRLNSLAIRHGIYIFARIGCGAVITVGYMYSLGISVVSCLMSVVLSLYGAYLAGVLAIGKVQAAASPIATEIVASGLLDRRLIEQRKFFNLSVQAKSILQLFIPALVTNLSIIFCVYTAMVANNPYDQLLLRVVGDVLVSIITLVAFLTIQTRSTKRPLNALQRSLDILTSGSGNFRERLPSDLNDDFAFVTYQMNQAIGNFQEVIDRLRSASADLNVSIQELGVSTQEISATSNQQAAGVKEIIATMEDSDQLSRRVASQAKEVATIAEGTKEVVNTGFNIIKDSLDKMVAIKEANDSSIRGIRNLGGKISNIWDIVNIINGIADQTKIIAFNAELEASSAGEAGRNFQIVATEIRRLADSTVSSTSEIKSRINEIQNSSDHLIIASEEGTAKITAGWELSNRLRTLFEDILSTSEISADQAKQIASSSGQQVMAFEQILLTLKQISSGIDNFVASTASTSRLTKTLVDMSVDVQQIISKYGE